MNCLTLVLYIGERSDEVNKGVRGVQDVIVLFYIKNKISKDIQTERALDAYRRGTVTLSRAPDLNWKNISGGPDI